MAGKIASSDTDKTRRLYTTFENGVTQTDGPEDRIMLSALLDKQYDFISLQPSAHAYDYNSMVNGTEEEDFVDYERELSYLTSTIREYQPNAEIVLFQTWTHYYGSAPYGDRASYYGTFLADAVWYEMFTGNRASAGTVDSPAITRPSGVGPLFQNGAIVEGQTKQYFTITAEEHHARLEQLADIAHQAVKEYNTLKRMK